MNAYNFGASILLFCGLTGRAAPLDSWDWRSPSARPTLNNLSAVAYGNGQFIAVGGQGTILTSGDGVNWTQQQSGTQRGLFNVAYGNGQFAACNLITGLTSSNGLDWRSHPLGGVALGYCNDRFLISNEDFTALSTNLVDWEVAGRFFASAFAYGNARYVAVGYDIHTSIDGLNWTTIPDVAEQLRSVAFGNGQFVAVGDGGAILTSVDGINWIQRRSATVATNTFLLGVAYGNGQFVAVGVGPATIITSSDGVNWSQRTSSAMSPDMYLTGVTYGDGRFVVVGFGGDILCSGSIISLTLTPGNQPGLVRLSLEGPTGRSYTIQSSAHLISWRDLTNIVSGAATFVLDLPSVTAGPIFYRAHSRNRAGAR